MTEQPPNPDEQGAKDAKAFAGGCLAGMGAVGAVLATVVLVLVAIVVVGVFLLYLACASG